MLIKKSLKLHSNRHHDDCIDGFFFFVVVVVVVVVVSYVDYSGVQSGPNEAATAAAAESDGG